MNDGFYSITMQDLELDRVSVTGPFASMKDAFDHPVPDDSSPRVVTHLAFDGEMDAVMGSQRMMGIVRLLKGLDA